MSYFVGIDIGSTTTKVVVLDNESVLDHKVVPTGVQCEETARDALELLLQRLQLRFDQVKGITTTGYGRRLVKFADHTLSEISANVQGALWFGGSVRTIINIGGQDSKVIALDEQGVTKHFAMNDKCAAGTGRFLETLARILEINVVDLGPLSLEADVPIRINSTCAVFAESEIISLVARGKRKGDIIAGAHYAIAKRVGRMVKRVGLNDTVFFDGGPAFNQGLVKALEDELLTDICVPPEVPQVTTAVGAALVARDNYRKACA